MGGSSDAPEAPDYVGAAKAQGAENLKSAIATGKLNNPNIANPFGSQQVTWQDVKDKAGNILYSLPTLNQKFSPEQKKLYDLGIQSKTALGKAGIQSAKNVLGATGKPVNFSNLPNTKQGMLDLRRLTAKQLSGTPQKYRNDVINAMMSRVNTDIKSQRNQQNSDLIAAGIRPGTEAYKEAMMQTDRQLNDARQQAILAGGQEAARDFGIQQQAKQTNVGNAQQFLTAQQQAQQQAIAQYLQQRGTPINEVNALLSGSQINNPFAGGLGYSGAGQVGAAPIAQATAQQGQSQQNLYNQQQANYNQNIGAGAGLLGSLGSAWLMSK